jgi:hypothetical protein
METLVKPMLEQASPRQRVAFALALAHAVLPQIDAKSQRGDDARAALDEAVRWVNGSAGGADGAPVKAASMTERLTNEDEEGIFIHAQLCPEREREAWVVIGTALGYAAWQAWRAQGELPAPLVYEFNEGSLPELCGLAQAAGVSAKTVDALREKVEGSMGREVDFGGLLAMLPSA